MWANYAVYLCAKTCKLLSDRTRFTELGEDNGCDSTDFAKRWTVNWDDLQVWLDNRPEDMLPTKSIPKTPFPTLLF